MKRKNSIITGLKRCSLFLLVVATSINLLGPVKSTSAVGYDSDPGYDIVIGSVLYLWPKDGPWNVDSGWQSVMFRFHEADQRWWNLQSSGELTSVHNFGYNNDWHAWCLWSSSTVVYYSPYTTADDPSGAPVYGWCKPNYDIAIMGINRIHARAYDPHNEPPENTNPQPEKALTVEPVNIISGYMTRDETDVVIPCPGINLEFSRSYNSGSTVTNGILGPKWSCSINWHLSESLLSQTIGYVTNIVNHIIKIRAGTMGELSMTITDTNNWNEWSGHKDVLWHIVKTNNEYSVNLGQGIEYVFDNNGFLRSMSDRWGNSVTYYYTNNLVSRIDHSNGQYLDFSYNSSNRLINVSTPSEKFGASFLYSDQGELTNATRTTSSETNAVSYYYDYSTNFCNYCITQIVNRADDIFSYQYATNSSGEITAKCTNSVVPSAYYATKLEYHPDTNEVFTTVTYGRGDTNLVSDYYYGWTTDYSDKNLRITRIVGPNSTNQTIDRKSVV